MLEVTCVCACKEGGLEVRRFKAVARGAFNRNGCAEWTEWTEWARVQIKCFKWGVVRERSAHFEHFPIGSAVEKVAKFSCTGSLDFSVFFDFLHSHLFVK